MTTTVDKIRIIGVDVWWDHKLQRFRSKKIDLGKVALKHRCPNCGKIVEKPKDREPLKIVDKEDRQIKHKEIDRLFQIEKPSKEEWDAFVNRHEELFIPKINLIERGMSLNLSWWGGVCKDCYLDGFGVFGDTGKFMGMMIKGKAEGRKKKREKNEEKTALWINGELVLVDKTIEPEYKLDEENMELDG